MSKYAVFRIAGELFGIEIGRVVEIIKPQKVFVVPGLPDFLCGVMSVRDAVIPLMDLRKRFGTESAGRKERIIVVRFVDEKIGFLVDEIKEILALETAAVTRPPSLFKGFRTEYIAGLGKKDNVIIILLNIDTLLSSEERIMLQESMGIIEATGAGD